MTKPNKDQEKAGNVASSFESTEFDPWIKNGHLQTILGTFLKETCNYVPYFSAFFVICRAILGLLFGSLGSRKKSSVWTKRERIETPDGDFFEADSLFTKTSPEKAPWVILCHGLGSSSEGACSQDMAKAYADIGMNCVCLNYRGCSGTHNKKLGCYHFGFTSDLQQYITLLREERGYSGPIYLSGFSLGANLVLYFLGKLGADAIKQNIRAGAVLCAPFDHAVNMPKLNATGINRSVYVSSILSNLKALAQWQLEEFCNGDEKTEKFDYPKVMAAATLMEFDDAYTAPIYGYENCWDYYRQTSCINHLENIHVPAFVLNARNDPFFVPELWPTEKTTECGGAAPLKLVMTAIGGHLGFFTHKVNGNDERLKPGTPSWASKEMARFFEHVRNTQE